MTNRYELPEGPLSPVRIPDEEENNEISDEGESPDLAIMPSSSSAQDILGLEEPGQQPS